jgi:hypothetical protein
MKRTLLALVLVFVFVPALHAAEWTGWITDSGCGAKGANAEHKDCSLRCAKRGESLVFYNSADEKLYKLDKQDEAKAQLGHKVKVVGELDGDSITVTSISDAGNEGGHPAH